jgi:hypothetical protein
MPPRLSTTISIVESELRIERAKVGDDHTGAAPGGQPGWRQVCPIGQTPGGTVQRRASSGTRTASGWPVSALELQRSAGNRATAALLTDLATPQIKPGPAVEVQKDLVTMLDTEYASSSSRRSSWTFRLAGLPNDEWKILVEVQYYRERDMSATGFHKDTLGETLFVTLNYHMDKQVISPEYVVNPPVSSAHETQIEDTLHATFREDLAVTRRAVLRAALRDGARPQVGTS